jgi:hypothetical protein
MDPLTVQVEQQPSSYERIREAIMRLKYGDQQPGDGNGSLPDGNGSPPAGSDV